MTNLPVSTLRPLLHQKLDQFTEGELAAVHQLLKELERRWVFAELTEQADQDASSGSLEPSLIEEAIQRHRTTQPYR